MVYFNKTYHPPGTPPGTLVAREEEAVAGFALHLVDYTAVEFNEKELASAAECLPFLERDSITWIHLQGCIRPEPLREIGEIFGLHSLALEDILNTGQRPKVEEYDDQLFVVMAMPDDVEGETSMHQVSIFLGQNYVISFHCGANDPFDPLRTRLKKKTGRIRNHGADYLLYCILDLVIDQGFPLLEKFGEALELVEEELLGMPAKETTLAKTHQIRRELLLLRRHLWPHREVVNSLLRDEISLIQGSTYIYLRDCYDHTIEILELVEHYRDMAASLVDVYLSAVSHRLNEIMRVLTMFATIFIPLTFLVGLYGMNFSHPDSPWAMPELHWYYGYPMVWGIMVTVVIGMVVFFKRNKWF